jgi:hypothetical protein
MVNIYYSKIQLIIYLLPFKLNFIYYVFYCNILGIGDWGLGIGDWGLGPIPNPQIPNPQSPIPIPNLV